MIRGLWGPQDAQGESGDAEQGVHEDGAGEGKVGECGHGEGDVGVLGLRGLDVGGEGRVVVEEADSRRREVWSGSRVEG